MEEPPYSRPEEASYSTQPAVYTRPRMVNDIKDCYFYHTMDLPGLGRIEGDWDLHLNIKNYLGGVDFKGKRVLDVGCASGVLSFHMEQQGADVVSFDLDKSQDWDLVPFAKWEELKHRSKMTKILIDQSNNAYWLAHRLLGSTAKAVNGSVYAIPETIGPVEIVVLGSILLHLRDPFLALQSALRLCTKTAIIADLHYRQNPSSTEPVPTFLPDPKTVEPIDTWWNIPPEWVVRAIAVLGFEKAEISYHTQRGHGQDMELYTVVGTRTHGHFGAGEGRRENVELGARILSVQSPNGVESIEGQSFLWIRDQPTRFMIESDHEMVVTLTSEGVVMGLSIRQSYHRRLRVRSAGAVEEFEVKHRLNARVHLHPGINMVEVWGADEAEIVEQPNGDTRVLLLGILNYHLGPGDGP